MRAPELTVSVAMATYNGAKHLAIQLASIAAQTRLPDEIVVGDDQSSDDTLSIIESFRKETGLEVRVKINEMRLGTIKNFESIIARCEGDIIVFSDQDDLWRPDKLEKMLETFHHHPTASYAFSNGSLLDDAGDHLSGTIWKSFHFLDDEQSLFHAGRGIEVLLRHNVVLGCTLGVSRDALQAVLPMSTYHDYWSVCVLEAIGMSGVLIHEPLISYRLHAAQQIGVFQLSSSKITSILNERGEAYYLREAETFRQLATISRNKAASPYQLRIIEEKIQFSERRAEMRRRPFLGFWLSMASMLNGDYSRFTHRQKFAGVTIPLAILLDVACIFISIFSRSDALDQA